MKQVLRLEIPDEIYQALQREAATTDKSLEQVALEWIAQRAQAPKHGSVDALMPFYGAWRMTPEERAHIEQMIDEERHMEENGV